MELVTHLVNKLGLKEKQVINVLKLLNEGGTIPFIARYKKEETGNLEDFVLRELVDEKTRFENLEERRKTILKSISEQGKLTPELEKEILGSETLSSLEALYRPYRPKKKSKATIAIEKGLKPLFEYLIKQANSLEELNEYATSFIDSSKEINTKEEALEGALNIFKEEVSDNTSFFLFAKNYIYRRGNIEATNTKEDIENKYQNYQNFSEPITRIKNHQVLALLRGKKEKKITFSFKYDKETIINEIARQLIRYSSSYKDILRKATQEAYKRLMAPSIEKEITNELFLKAEEASLKLFSKNLKQLLLSSPLKGRLILGFDPGYRNGCKLALINKEGSLLEAKIIYPTIGREREAKDYLLSLYKKYPYEEIALGNGTASRESEAFLRSFIEENSLQAKINVTIVNESGASVYSASKLAIEEFPTLDIDLRSAVSLARRLLDPMAELVKIPPEAIGVGQYQHDMDPKLLKETLENATIDAVNEVGVWLNTASFSLLRYVNGIGEKLAKEIILYKEKNGPFKTRKDLLKVKGFGPKAFMDASGFLRIENDNPLERTAVHPKDYESTKILLKTLGLSLSDIGKDKCNQILASNLDLLSLEKTTSLGEYTLKDILEELRKPGRDKREKIESAKLANNVTKIEDLKEGMILEGTVRNIADFGVFVDIGIHQDGLIHISELANHFIKHPGEVVSLGELLKVKVISVDIPRKRISLSKKALDN